jgi:hypothetical protein
VEVVAILVEEVVATLATPAEQPVT